MKKTNPTMSDIIKNPELYKEETKIINTHAKNLAKSISTIKNKISNFNIKSKEFDNCKSILDSLGRKFTEDEINMTPKELLEKLISEFRDKKLNDLGI